MYKTLTVFRANLWKHERFDFTSLKHCQKLEIFVLLIISIDDFLYPRIFYETKKSLSSYRPHDISSQHGSAISVGSPNLSLSFVVHMNFEDKFD